MTEESTGIVEVAHWIGDQEFRTCAQRTASPHLMVIPEIREQSFTGGFTALHVPTGRVLSAGEYSPVPPELIDDAILGVADLDWSSPDREVYRKGRNRGKWETALRMTVEDAHARGAI